MTIARDLMIVALDVRSAHPVERGDLSLALAGAELIDLLDAQAIGLDGDHIVPSLQQAITDHLLDEAASSLVRQPPYESVGDWLWRRGRGLSAAYLAALEAEGHLVREQGRRWMVLRTSRLVSADSPAHRQAADRWTADEPVLAALAAAAGIGDKRTGDSPSVPDDATATVLAAVHDASNELAAERQRRDIEEAAFDNVWRGE
ncbi:GOLPH3/VPS74 family protein [Streptomyces sp. NPDC001514]